MNWVQCDGCEEWFHLLCIGLAEDEVSENEEYMCFRCKLHASNATGFIMKDQEEATALQEPFMADINVDSISEVDAAPPVETMAIMDNGVPEPVVGVPVAMDDDEPIKDNYGLETESSTSDGNLEIITNEAPVVEEMPVIAAPVMEQEEPVVMETVIEETAEMTTDTSSQESVDPGS